MEDTIQSQDGQPENQDSASQNESIEQLRARNGGLNRAYQKLQQESQQKLSSLEGLVADLTGKVKTYEGSLKDYTGQIDTYKSKEAEYMERLSGLEQQSAIMQQVLERQKMFMLPPDQGGFNDLAALEAKGLLRTDLKAGDELKQYLQTYRETIGANRREAVQQTLAGTTPPANGNNKTDTVPDREMLYNQMVTALKSGSQEEFQRLNALWIEGHNK
jgi:chromosome segregation ATPase